jgi:hypothetical protein
MTVITLTKTIPASARYTGSGVTTINLKSFQSFIINSKKSLIKYNKLKTKNKQAATPTDEGDNQVIDLKNIEQTIKITGYLEDDASETAWNKLMKLIAMQTSGGPLTTLSIGTAGLITFPNMSPAVYPTSTPQAFLETVTGEFVSDDTGDITAIHSAYPARIKIDIDLYLGYQR